MLLLDLGGWVVAKRRTPQFTDGRVQNGMRSKKKRFAEAALLLVFLAVAAQAGIATTLAQGGGVHQTEVEAGPYRVALRASQLGPSPGDVDVAIAISDGTTGSAVTDAQVKILTLNNESGVKGWTWAVHNPLTPGTYTAVLKLESPGTWELSVEVSGSKGNVTVDGPSLAVQRGGRWAPSAGNVAFVGVIAVLALGATYVWWSARRMRKRQEVEDKSKGDAT